MPQFLPKRAQKAAFVSDVQTGVPHTLAVLAPQVSEPEQVPHEATVRETPQLSIAVTAPQFFPSRVQKAASLSFGQPQTFAVPPPPQVWGKAQVPHEVTVRARPQLSVPLKAPHFFPRRSQKAASVSGGQPQTLAVPPPPQV